LHQKEWTACAHCRKEVVKVIHPMKVAELLIPALDTSTSNRSSTKERTSLASNVAPSGVPKPARIASARPLWERMPATRDSASRAEREPGRDTPARDLSGQPLSKYLHGSLRGRIGHNPERQDTLTHGRTDHEMMRPLIIHVLQRCVRRDEYAPDVDVDHAIHLFQRRLLERFRNGRAGRARFRSLRVATERTLKAVE